MILMGAQIISSDLREWELAATLPGATLNDVCWGEGRFVAIGDSMSYISADGLNWSLGNAMGSNSSKVTCLQGTFFAMGFYGINRSTDGVNWSTASSVSTNNISCNEDTFIAVGNDGNIQRSTDKGITWQSQTSGTSKDLFSTTYWNGRFFAVGEHLTIRSSTTGVFWNFHYQDNASDSFLGVIPWEEDLLALGSNTLFRSSNGTDWSPSLKLGYDQSLPRPFSLTDLGSFLASVYGSSTRLSSDGNSWSHKFIDHLPLGVYIHGMATNGHTWVAVTGTDGVYISRPDHRIWWQDLQQAMDFHFLDVLWDGKQWVAVGNHGGIMLSTDGVHWRFVNSLGGSNSFYGIAYGNGQYVTVGKYGRVYVSSNAVDWGLANSGTTDDLYDVLFDGTAWLAVGENGTAISTTNPGIWNTENTGIAEDLNGLALDYSGNIWVVGDNGTCSYRWPDGSWHPYTAPSADSMLAVVAKVGGAGAFAVGENGTVWRYQAGIQWELINSGTSEDLYDVHWSEGHQINIVGANGTLLNIHDWYGEPTLSGSFTDSNLRALASNSVTQLAVGLYGSCGMAAPSVFGTSENVMEIVSGSGSMGGIVWTGELFVALHDRRKISTSTDGKVWEYRSTGPVVSGGIFHTLHWDGQKLYVVSDDELYEIQNFTTWVGGDHQFYATDTQCMASRRGQLVIGGTRGYILYGPDLDNLTSTLVAGLESYSFEKVIWNGLRYIATTQNSEIAQSVDGVNWNRISPAPYANGIATKGDGVTIITSGRYVYYSEDGFSFEIVHEEGSLDQLTSVTWTGEAFVALGRDGIMLTSRNGLSWTREDRSFTGSYDKLVSNGNDMLAGKQDGIFTEITLFPLASGTKWGRRKVQKTHDIYGLAFNGKKYVSVGVSGQIYVSPNGIEWCEADSATGNALNDIEWIGDRFLAVGNYGKIVSSPDGTEWTLETSGTSSHLRAIASDGDIALAGGQYGRIYRSANKGENWALVAELPYDVNGIVWRGGTWVAVGTDGMIQSSSDGMNWVIRKSKISSDLKDICETKYGFLAVGYQGRILESVDGISWVRKERFTTSEIFTTVEAFGDRIMIGSYTGIWSGSFDFWEFKQVFSGDKIEALVRNDQWVAVGEDGTILVSTWGSAIDPPLVSAENADMQVCEGSDVIMQVNSVTNHDSINYKWYKGPNELSGGGPTFTISSFNISDEGLYSCRTWNAGGITEVFFTLTSAGAFGGEIEKQVYVQGINPISIMALINCDINPPDFIWTDLGTMQTFGNGNNPASLPSSVTESTTVQVDVTDTVTSETFQDSAIVLIADDPAFFNLNGDSCNNINDLYNALEEWRQPSSLDANNDGKFNLLDFLYINLDGCD